MPSATTDRMTPEHARGYADGHREAVAEMETLRPMESAPKDGRYILVAYEAGDERYPHWKGRAFVARHEGQTASGFDLGWALFPGYGGVPDHSFAGWLPLPTALIPTNTPREGGE